MKMFLITLLECSATMSIISLVYVAAIPLLSKRYSAKWLYYIWLVNLIGWIFPFRPYIATNNFPVQIPKVQTIQVIQAQYAEIGKPLKILTSETGIASSIPLWWVIAGIWVAFAAGIIAYNAWKHMCFLKMVNRWSEDITDIRTIDVLDVLKAEMKIRTHVGLKTSPVITSPMMVGFFKHTILLPSLEIEPDELKFILWHELVHLKRNDLWYKALVLFVTAVNWFNPVVYIMAKSVALQCEISCDERLIQETSLEQRKKYGEILIRVVRNGVKQQTALSTNFYKEGNFIKTRIFRIMDTNKKKAGITALCVILIAIMTSGVTFASNLTNDKFAVTQPVHKVIDPAKVKQIINVDVKDSGNTNSVCLGGPYTLEEGDIIRCNINAEGNPEDLIMTLLMEDIETSNGKPNIQELTVINSKNQASDNQVKVTKTKCGYLCLYILNNNGHVPSNIIGTIEIIDGKA